MPAVKKKKNPDSPDVMSAPGLSIKIIGAIAGVVTSTITLYHFVFAPDSNLIGVAGFGMVVFSLCWIAAAVFLSAKSKSKNRKPKRIAVPVALLAVSPLFFFWSRSLGPEIGEISISKDDDEQIDITGRNFGSSAAGVRVMFIDKEQTPISVAGNRLQVAIPPGFQKGDISVRRGPRTSSKKYFAFPGVSFDAVVVFLFRPSGMDSLVHNMAEMCPHFPWYSYESDHYSSWPSRQKRDCIGILESVKTMFDAQGEKEVSKWEASHADSKVTMMGRGADEMLGRFLNLRANFRREGSDLAALARQAGPQVATQMGKAESAFRSIDDGFPNRLLLLKIRNEQNSDAENIQINIKVKNEIYDAMVDLDHDQAAMQEKLHKNLSEAQNVLNLDLPRLRPGNEAEIKVWYYFHEPGFSTNDAVDRRWESYEGIMVNNIGATNLHFKRNRRLYEGFKADSIVPVDPVRPRSKAAAAGD